MQSKAARGLMIVLLAQVPFLLLYARNLWQLRPHYEFFPFMLIAIGVLAWQRWPRAQDQPSSVADTEQGRSVWWLECVLLGLGLAILTGAVVLFSPWLSAVAGALIVGGMLLRFGGSGVLGQLFPVWLLLWLVVAPPLRLDQDLVRTMQRTTSQASSTALDALGAKHLMAGNVIELPGKRLFVAEACSGVHSQLVLIACAAIYVVVARRTWLRGGLLVASAFFWATLVNIARVTFVAILSIKTSWDLSTGWPHELLGFSLVAIGFLLLACTDQLLALILARVPLPGDGEAGFDNDPENQRANPLAVVWNRFLADPLPQGTVREDADPDASWRFDSIPLPTAFVAVCACLGVLQVATILTPNRDRTISLAQADDVYDESSLPEQLDQWERAEFVVQEREKGSDEGRCSQIWRYRAADQMVHVSVDYPFLGWHELTGCYTSQGWTVDSRKKHETASPSGDFVAVELSKPTGEYGLLMFGLFDGTGRPLAPRAGLWRSFAHKLTTNPLLDRLLGQREVAAPGATSIQVQQLLVGRYRLLDDERQLAQERFQTLQNRLRTLWINRNDGHTSTKSLPVVRVQTELVHGS